MSDLILRTAVKSRVTAHGAASALARLANAAAVRLQREQTGQDMVEYGGIMLVIAVIIGAMVTTGLPGHIVSLVKSAVDNVFNGHNPSVTAGQTGTTGK